MLPFKDGKDKGKSIPPKKFTKLFSLKVENKLILCSITCMSPIISFPLINPSSDSEILEDVGNACNLIVWNDDVNTFDWVIETLIQICGHNQEQAEQCALLIHTKGKYAVKNGSYTLLKPQCDAITERSINATIESWEN